MAKNHPIVLRASAGPRIRSAQRPVTGSPEWVLGELHDRALRHAGTGGTEAAAILRSRLREGWRDLLPWPVTTPRPTRRIGLVIGGAAAVSGLAWLTPLSIGWVITPLILGGAQLLLMRRGADRQAHQISESLAEDIEAGASLAEIEGQVEALLRVQPEHDAARLLLAAHRLERGEALAALMQLAPLRDRHPDAGEIVLLGALAYASLDLHRDALRMLEVLNVDADHPCREWVLRLRAACGRSVGEGTRASSGEDLGVDAWPDDL